MPKRADSNQRELVAALRAAGCAVQDCHQIGQGFPDLLVCPPPYASLYLLEVKSKWGKVTRREHEWHTAWPGEVHIVKTAEEALRAVGLG